MPTASPAALGQDRLFIGGRWIEASDGRRFDVINPATGALVGAVADASAADVERAIDAAAAALPAWRRTTASDRARVLRRAAAGMRARVDEIAATMTAEQGKPLPEAAREVEYAASFFDWFAGEAERVYGQIVPASSAGKRILVLRQGVGVTGAITPWNFPAAMLTRKLGPAIAAGCTSIAKPAEATPLTALAIARILHEADLPAGVVNMVTSSQPSMVADVMLGDARLRKLSFTGSTEVGKTLIRRSAEQVQRLSLELGGHAPFIVFDDAEVETAVAEVMASKFRNAGQTCICANRVVVQRRIYTQFLECLSAKTAALRVGPGTVPGVDLGPLINAEAVHKVELHVADAVARGARATVGGTRLTDRELSAGHFYAPTVLDGISAEMLISREETFGPVAGLTAFEREADVITMANCTPYGLAAYAQTSDYARIFRLAEQLDFGVIGINDGAPSNPAGPFGGLKQSGFGREGGACGIDEYLDIKYVSIGGVTS